MQHNNVISNQVYTDVQIFKPSSSRGPVRPAAIQKEDGTGYELDCRAANAARNDVLRFVQNN